jgi:branched-chain amino acid transport system permease protein
VAAFVVAGLIAGSIYALLAVGLVFMFQTTGVVNFAFGAMGAVAAYTFATLRTEFVPVAALVLVVAGGGVVGALLGAVTIPVQRSSITTKAVATLALIQAIIGIVPIVWSNKARPAPILATGRAFRIASVNVSRQQVIALALSVAATIGVVAFFRLGRLGSALRAMAASTNVARLVGLRVRQLWIMSWTLTTAVAALAGTLIAPTYGLSATGLSTAVLYPLSAALAAGFRRPVVATVAGFALGIADSLIRSKVGPFKVRLFGAPLASYAAALPFLLAVVALSFARSNATWERV